jgi:anaerobic magnesium-protoporphyrin IX monomethyl ester cyclase
MENYMKDCLQDGKDLEGITSRMILAFPPEFISEGRYICRYEPDGIAMINGFLKEKGYHLVDLVFSPVSPLYSDEKILHENSPDLVSPPYNRDGASFHDIVNTALNLSLDSPTAVWLRDLLPLRTLPETTIIGFSVGFPTQLYYSIVLARIAKALNPNLFVVFGGRMVSSSINFLAGLTELTSIVSGIIPGYGEEPLVQLMLCLEEKGDLKEVANLYLPAIDGFQRNVASWKPDKSHLLTVPDFGQKNLQREFDPYYPIRPSIGCYWAKCAFCSYPSMTSGAVVKEKCIILNPEELVEYIKVLMMNGSGNRFELCSDALPPHYLRMFSEQVIKSELNIVWSAWACVDKRFLDKGVLETMKQAGCDSVLLGVESACQRTLQRINKMQTTQDIDSVLSAFSSAGVGLFVTFFVGFPGETYEEAMVTIEYVRALLTRSTIVRKEDVRLYCFGLMDNTPILANFRDFGIASVDTSDMYYCDDDFVFSYEVLEGISSKEALELVMEWRHRLGIPSDYIPIPLPHKN